MRDRWTDRSTGPLQPVDPRSQDRMSFSLSPSSCVWPVEESDRPVECRSIIGRGTVECIFDTLSLLVAGCYRWSTDRYPVENRSEVFFTFSLSQWLYVTGRGWWLPGRVYTIDRTWTSRIPVASLLTGRPDLVGRSETGRYPGATTVFFFFFKMFCMKFFLLT